MVQGQIQALVLCGPSGAGKSTLLNKLFQDYPDRFGFSVSHTTRTPRPGEVNGVHYYFTSREEMENSIRNGEFIESATYSNNIYGTSKKAVEDVVKEGKICVLDIDVQGVKQVKEKNLCALYVFVKPLSLDVLAQRLRGRGTETQEALEKRLKAAKEEIEYGEQPNNFHLVLVNDCFEKAYDTFRNFVFKELEKQNKNSDPQPNS